MKSLWEFLEVSWRGKSQQNHYVYEFGPFQLDATRRVLLKGGEPLRRFPKEFETLMALVKRCGELLKKDDLMRQVWAPNYGPIGRGDGSGNIDWTSDGKVLYSALYSESSSIWTMDGEGEGSMWVAA